MYRLSRERRCHVVRCLVDGVSVRGTARLTGVSRSAILRLLEDLGLVCEAYLDSVLRVLPCRRIQCDEIWSFCYAKKGNVPPERKGQLGYGDLWTWVAMCPDSRLVVTWLVGKRDAHSANQFMADLALRLAHRVQLTTDGFSPYVDAVRGAFGNDVDYAMVVKDFGESRSEKTVMSGSPNPDYISTSLIERQNLTMRMEMRRFTRRTNGHSKKVENHAAMLALYYLYYNFARPHEGCGFVSPAQAAGVSSRLWKAADIVGLLEDSERPVIQ